MVNCRVMPDWRSGWELRNDKDAPQGPVDPRAGSNDSRSFTPGYCIGFSAYRDGLPVDIARSTSSPLAWIGQWWLGTRTRLFFPASTEYLREVGRKWHVY